MTEVPTHRVTRPDRKGPLEGTATIGVDADPGRRPGVPPAAPPSPEGVEEERAIQDQRPHRDEKLHREALDEPTPVFGSAQLHRGPVGRLRAAAYEIPEYRARHWMLLMLADRMDVAAARIRERPILSLGVTLGGALLLRRLLR